MKHYFDRSPKVICAVFWIPHVFINCPQLAKAKVIEVGGFIGSWQAVFFSDICGFLWSNLVLCCWCLIHCYFFVIQLWVDCMIVVLVFIHVIYF